MCGLAGWLAVAGQTWPATALGQMADSIAHRGPDDRGEYRDDTAGLALAHRRLAIIDLGPSSHQPMVDASSGVVLAYNGELYNFRAIRAQLEALGHSFQSAGDTEVVLRGYLQWGIECLSRFAGMFALAIWDPRHDTLHLARDAMGIKPLYMHPSSHGVAFASELKAFLQLPGFVAETDPVAVEQYLEFGYVFADELTILRGVAKLGPGERVEIQDGRITRRIGWFVVPAVAGQHRHALEDQADELGHVLRQVVSEHLVADVPVGLLLSGGLDSSIIAALAAREGPLTTICMGFDNSDIDERAYARQVATHVGSTHIEMLITPQQIREEIETGAWVFDDLFADWGTMSTRLLYRRIREQGIKVVLVGEGADELFGGYDVFNVPQHMSLWTQFRLYQRYAGRRYGRLFGEFRRVMQSGSGARSADAFEAVRLFESRKQLPNQYAMKVDKASMAESIEARAPYLDKRVAELAYQTPRASLLHNGENKFLLRSLARTDTLLPPAIASRNKFGAPLAAGWMDSDPGFRSFARERILRPSSQTQQLGLTEPMRKYFDKGHSGSPFPGAISIFRNLAWRLLLLELWAEHYLPNTPGQRSGSISFIR